MNAKISPLVVAIASCLIGSPVYAATTNVDGKVLTVTTDQQGTTFQVSNGGHLIVDNGGIIGGESLAQRSSLTGSTLDINSGGISGSISASANSSGSSSTININSGGKVLGYIATNARDGERHSLSINNASVTSNRLRNFALDLQSTNATINDSTITNSAHGINLSFDSIANINNSVINATGTVKNGGYGIVSMSSELTMTNSEINYTGPIGSGAALTSFGSRLNDSNTLVSNSKINSTDTGAYLIGGNTTISNTEIISQGNNAILLQGGELNLANHSSIKALGNGFGLLLYKGEESGDYLENNVTLNNSSIETEAAPGILVSGDTTATIKIENNSNIISGFGTFLQVFSGAKTAVSLDDSQIVGNVISVTDAITDITLQNSASLTGKMQNVNNLNLNTQASWTLTESSNLNHLTINNATIRFADNSNDATFNTLTMDDLSGSGTFIMRTDIAGDGNGINNSGDKLIVTGTSQGNHNLTIVNRGDLSTTGNETLTIVETQDGQAKFALTPSAPKVELGGYLYDVRQNGNNWELYGASSTAVEPPTPGGGGSGITTTADAGANFLNIGYLLNYAETQTLLQRMGDLRQNGEHGDIWLRGFAGKFDSFSGGKLSRFDMSYSGMQIGADKRISPEVPLFVGMFMGQTNGSPDYRTGDGTTKSSNAGIYGSYMADSGFYLDSVLKYSHLKNSFNVKDSQNSLVRGNGNSDGVSFSMEAGQKFNLNEQNNGFYIEPQAQLSYGHQDATQVRSSNGLKINLGSYESLMGRASTLFGYQLNQGDNKINVYLKTGIVREFEGDVDYQLNGSTENHTFKGNWWNNGVGVSAQIAKQHSFYLDIDSSTGNKFDQRQINGGYRFSF
ncbi:autotransporter outer membrane beta-barrel domain-containing protein [Budvicia aquatica]|uniref:Autotransporter outer membrane beta-barrel domain-containing protein n=1 Tax=Budvicia aquatica TaxID=82979 RepID=A0A2C6DK53_9GAMM|nr:autotransporter outer membrane beta-barrel domain-containing protein [Budvicia aquatica]PHI29073.1 autotransporter outer membrane beta-barrel domain-containing protein [Budvicia aquatica]VFS47231.1 P.93 [Budvicia aquatica]